VTAVDADVGDNGRITYELNGIGAEKFSVDVESGVITASELLDRETEPRYTFNVVAVDAGSPPLSSSVVVVVDLQDVNDHSPLFHQPRGYAFDVGENLPDGTELGMAAAEDADSGTNGEVRYRLRGGPSSHLFQVDADTGTLSTRQRLDRERASKHLLSVVAYDGGMPSRSASVIVRVSVLDVNDNPPRFRFPSQFNNTVHLSPDTPRGFVVAHLDAVDPDLGNNARVTYAATLDPDAETEAASPFTVEPQSGAVVVVDSLKQKDGEWFDVGVMVTDDGGLAATSVLFLVVNSSSTFGLLPASPEASPADRRTGLPGIRLMVVVGVVIGCGLLALTLIIAIIVVRAQQTSKRTRHYNCRTAACVRLQQTTSPAWAGHAGAPLSVEVYTAKSLPGSPASPPNDKLADTTCSTVDERAISGSLRSSIYNGTWSSGSRPLEGRYQPSPCCRTPSLDCSSLACLRYNQGQVRQQPNCGKI